MRVQMLTTVAGPNGVIHAGQVVDVPDAQGKLFVAGGFAIEWIDGEPEESRRRRESRAHQVRELGVPTDLITQERAAELLEVNSKTVREYIKKGKLRGYDPGNKVSRAECEAKKDTICERRPRSKRDKSQASTRT